MAKRPQDSEFEVVEEIVGDLDYFYEEDDDFEGTAKIRTKLLIRNIFIGLLVFLFITTVIGYIQISIYCSSDGRPTTVVTDKYKDRVEYLKTIESNYEYLIDFYSVNDRNEHVGHLINNVNTVYMDNGVEVPYNEKSDKSSAEFIEEEIYNLEKLLENYENDSDGILGTYKTLLPKNDDAYKNLHYALEECMKSAYDILTKIQNNKLNVDDENISRELKYFAQCRVALMGAWESANELLKG